MLNFLNDFLATHIEQDLSFKINVYKIFKSFCVFLEKNEIITNKSLVR